MSSYPITRLEKTDGVVTMVHSTTWKSPVEHVIKWIEEGKHSFYTIIGTDMIDIHVKSDGKTKYLTTSQDWDLSEKLDEEIVREQQLHHSM